MTRKNCIKVCIRTRPTQYFAQDQIRIDEEHSTVQIMTGSDAPDQMLNNKQNSFKFTFDHVFHNASQQAVYDLFARDTVQGVMDGINGAVMSYGQTGSGKTFTMMGDTSNYEHRGVAPRALGQIFSEVNSRIEFEFRVTCTYMEIYNERIFDLLADLSNPDQAADYTIVEEKDGRGTFVRGLTEVEVRTENEALNLLFGGELSRTTATHKLNRRSNRSHSLFTVYIQQRQRSGVSEKIGHSKLHLIDLAGSERLKKTMDSTDGRVDDEVIKKESMGINRSLTYLEQCVVALARRGQTHIPYRQSKLTNILKDCLGANCNTLMLACMWGEADHLEETISTLRLASRMMKVQNETSTVETVDSDALIKKQARLIRALKQELLMHDALVERAGVAYEPYTPEQQASMLAMCERYVAAKELDEDEVISINSYRQMLEVCKQFKHLVLTARAEAAEAKEEAANGYHRAATGGHLSSDGEFAMGSRGEDTKIIDEFNPKAPVVGENETFGRSGFALGAASSESRPMGGIDAPNRSIARGAPAAGFDANRHAGSALDSPTMGSPGRSMGGGDGSPLGKGTKFGGEATLSESGNSSSAQFTAYIEGEGKDIYGDFVQSKAYVKELRQKMKDNTSTVNQRKAVIDQIQDQLDQKKRTRMAMFQKSGLRLSDTQDIVDEEEFQLMKDLKEAKKAYKLGYDQLQRFKQSIEEAAAAVERNKAELTSRFAAFSTSTVRGSMTNSELPRINQGGKSAFTQSFGKPAGDGGNASRPPAAGQDQLDDQEAFDRLEEARVLANDPDSLAFFHAQKTRRALMTQNSSTLKNMQKNKRLG